MQDQTLTERAKTAIVSAMEKMEAKDDGEYILSELGNAYAAILEAEAKQDASNMGTKLLEELKNM